MSWVRRNWTAKAADQWSKEDVLATVFSVAAYLLIILGGTLSLLALAGGYWLLAAGLLAAWAMHYVIDPKLRAVSDDYAKKQKEYIERMEQLTRWEKRT